ncbi:hypothetical protein B0H10DRAFT_1953631 [Mycena sp. CBHHK59/15]|nr:hypothetical protein B0H10DRAFT_1953631 [Mycena sp. CBHHK59/15]
MLHVAPPDAYKREVPQLWERYGGASSFSARMPSLESDMLVAKRTTFGAASRIAGSLSSSSSDRRYRGKAASRLPMSGGRASVVLVDVYVKFVEPSDRRAGAGMMVDGGSLTEHRKKVEQAVEQVKQRKPNAYFLQGDKVATPRGRCLPRVFAIKDARHKGGYRELCAVVGLILRLQDQVAPEPGRRQRDCSPPRSEAAEKS